MQELGALRIQGRIERLSATFAITHIDLCCSKSNLFDITVLAPFGTPKMAQCADHYNKKVCFLSHFGHQIFIMGIQGPLCVLYSGIVFSMESEGAAED